MSGFKRLVIEALVDKNHLSLLNAILDNLKAHFSRRCTVTESIDESSGAANIFVTIEGDLEFSDLEGVGLDIIKLNNLGCQVSFIDRLERKRFVSHANNALVYGESDTPLRRVHAQPQTIQDEVREAADKPRWGRSLVLWLIVLLAIFAFRAISVRDTTALKQALGAAPGHSESLPAKPGTPSPLPADPSPTKIPQFQMPMFGVPIGNGFVNKATLEQLQKIVREYHASHTYSMDDLFVCVDMAIDVWNILKTKKINAKILAGRVDQDITHLTGLQYIGQINHAWVVAEPQPGVAVPLEITGGFVVTPDKPNYRLYFEGTDFNSPKAFKEFIELRGRVFDTCQQVQSMENHFNATFAGKPITQDSVVYKGRLEQKVQDCVGVLSQLQNVILARN